MTARSPTVRLTTTTLGSPTWAFAPHAPATHLLRCDELAGPATLHDPTARIARFPRPLDALRWLDTHRRPAPDAPTGRWVGYLAYEAGRWFETLPHHAVDDLRLPLFAFAYVPGSHEVRAPKSAEVPVKSRQNSIYGVSSSLPRPRYLDACRRVIDFIRAGDIFQANLTHRVTVPLSVPPRVLSDRLTARRPAAYGAFLDFGDFQIVGNSPELFLRVTTGRRVITRPIKGTRPNDPGMLDDLLNSPKDAAELHMVVDLERNDLGRVCEIGSVRVTQPRTIETHPTVLHGVATVEGVLRPDVGLVDLLRATFPGGSVTGAPKIRAMQIIDELEPVARGPYCGAVVSLTNDGAMEMNLAIRTIVCRNGLAHFGIGGGIVADSDPEAEWEETLVKAAAMAEALGIEQATLREALR